jgi:hypothetical protein
MHVELVPVLRSLRALYDVADAMKRFRAYVALLTGTTRGEPLPIGVFSPMGARQPAFLDGLLALGAEDVAADAARAAETRLAGLPDRLRALLVVADVPRNGWTERNLTDAEWRFSLKYDLLARKAPARGFERWVSIQLWTDEPPAAACVRRETLAALYRAAHRRVVGAPRTLHERMRQEGRALAFAGATPRLDADELAFSREALAPYLASAHAPTCFAALYGDAAARAVGYRPLGLATRAGFDVALADALEGDAPERALSAHEPAQGRSPA